MPLARSANPARNSVPIQFNALHTSFRPSRNPIDPTRLRRHYRRSNAAAHRNEQLRLLPIQSPPPQFARRGSWANSPGPHSQPSSLHVSAPYKEVNSLLRRHQLPQVCKCNRGLRCQLSCAKYPHPIPSHPIPHIPLIPSQFPGGNPMVPGIMHTYHARHVVATRPGLPPSSDAVGAEYGGHLPRATIICRCN